MEPRDISKLEQAVAVARDTWPHLMEAFKVYKDCLVKAGFTQEEALYITSQHTTPYGFKGEAK